ncbi:MAG: LamG domain-containing protein, partial [Candidatus Aenigmarchaeota archaeon]|nr:LamG domain-containing protein [Candidatus Aenigmarchaeota archaeon]
MSYERFIERNGKIYGPYVYRSIRDEKGNVKNIYVGRKDEKKSSLLMRILPDMKAFSRKRHPPKVFSGILPVLFAAVLMTALIAVAAYAAPFDRLTIQGQLRDSSNNILSGNYNFSFNIYSQPTGGSSLYEKNFTDLYVDTNGIYTATLTGLSLPFDQDYYIGINVNSDGEMTPRLNLTDMALAFRSNRSEYLGSYSPSYFLNTSTDMQTVGGNLTVSDTLLVGSGGYSGGGVTIDSSGNLFMIGNMTLNTNALFIDSSLTRVGIGTANPQYTLQVLGNVSISGNLISKTLYRVSSQDLVVALNFDNGTVINGNKTVLDSSGHNNHGIVYGSAAYNASGGFNGGGAFEFDGNTGYIDLPTFISKNASGAYSFSLWYKTHNASATEDIMGKSITFFIVHRGDSTNNQFEARLYNGTQVYTVAAPNYDQSNKWYYVVFVVDRENEELRLYVDGQLEDTQTIDDAFGDVSMNSDIGGRVNSWWMNGTLDDVQIYHRALSADEIAALYYQRAESHDSFVSQKYLLVNKTTNALETDMNITTTDTVVASNDVCISGGNCLSSTGGTVTSVGLSLPSEFSVSGSPVTGSGTLTGSWQNQNANEVFAGPTSGGAATPGFRTLVDNDIPNALTLSGATIGSSSINLGTNTYTGTLGGGNITDATISKSKLSNSGTLGFDWSDSEVSDTITASNYVRKDTWTDIDDYPTGCSPGQAVRVIGDTLTCVDTGNTTAEIIAVTNNTAHWNASRIQGSTEVCIGSDCKTSWPAGGNTTEEMQDAAWSVLGGTQQDITVTYNDAGNAVNFVVDEHWLNESGDTLSGTLQLGGATYSIDSTGDADLRYVGIGTNPGSTYPLNVAGDVYLQQTTYLGTTSTYFDTSGNLVCTNCIGDSDVSNTLTASNLVAASEVVSDSEVSDAITISGGTIYLGTNTYSGTLGGGNITTASIGAAQLGPNSVSDSEIDYGQVTLSDFTNDAGFQTVDTNASVCNSDQYLDGDNNCVTLPNCQ